MKKLKPSLIIGLCLACTAIHAETPANASSSEQIGSSTQAWLELQKSGEQASKQSRLLSGDVASRNYQRYLKSFETEVPEQFETGVSAK